MAQEGKYYDLFNFNKKILNLGSILISIKRWPQYISMRKMRRKNLNIRIKRKSDRCYILGLGPSLKNVDFTKISGDVIVVNRFYKFAEEEKLPIKPTFYCIMDDAFYNEEAIDDMQEAFEKYPDSSFVLNAKYHKAVMSLRKDIENSFYICMWGKQINKNSRIDFTKLVPVANNVLNTAILLAIYAGYKEVVLLGADFNSFASTKRNHCYTDDVANREFDLGFELYCYSFVAEDHRHIEIYSQNNNIKIYNATEGSLIDAYEKISFGEIDK